MTQADDGPASSIGRQGLYEEQKGRLFSNIAAAMGGVPDVIVERQLAHYRQVHPDYEAGVRAAPKSAHGYEADTISTAAE